MKKIKLNSLNSSRLKQNKLEELDQLNNAEKQKIFGGNHRVSSQCTLCSDDMCDSQYVNDNYNLPGLEEM